jgi:hypothetical protein
VFAVLNPLLLSSTHPPYNLPCLVDEFPEFLVSAIVFDDETFHVVVFAPDLADKILLALNCGIEFSVDRDTPPSERNKIDSSTTLIFSRADIMFSMFAAFSCTPYTSASRHALSASVCEWITASVGVQISGNFSISSLFSIFVSLPM